VGESEKVTRGGKIDSERRETVAGGGRSPRSVPPQGKNGPGSSATKSFRERVENPGGETEPH